MRRKALANRVGSGGPAQADPPRPIATAGRACLAALAFGAFSSCAEAPRRPAPEVSFAVRAEAQDLEPARGATDRVVVVALDGTRWQEIFRGVDGELAGATRGRCAAIGCAGAEVAPTLHRWMTEGGAAVGAPDRGDMRASGPNFVSLPGYTEILGGHPPDTCASNDCDATPNATIVDDVLAAGGDGGVVTSWEPIARAATIAPARTWLSAGRTRVESAWAFDAAALDAGRSADPWPGEGTFRPDAYTERVALALFTTMRPRFLFVGLGETDEFAHHGDYAGYVGAIRRADAWLAELEAAADEHTTFLVTTDHGRARTFRDHGAPWPESARVWLVAHGASIEARGLVRSPVERHLADVAPTVRALLGLARDPRPRAGAPLRELFEAPGPGPTRPTMWVLEDPVAGAADLPTL